MNSEHILIVEDDPKAENAEDGIRITQESLPDLILMDIRLPGMNGIDALRVLRKDPKTSAIPVIAVTASVMESQKEEAMGAGFDAIESKPVNIQSLLRIIRTFIERNPLSETT